MDNRFLTGAVDRLSDEPSVSSRDAHLLMDVAGEAARTAVADRLRRDTWGPKGWDSQVSELAGSVADAVESEDDWAPFAAALEHARDELDQRVDRLGDADAIVFPAYDAARSAFARARQSDADVDDAWSLAEAAAADAASAATESAWPKMLSEATQVAAQAGRTERQRRFSSRRGPATLRLTGHTGSFRCVRARRGRSIRSVRRVRASRGSPGREPGPEPDGVARRRLRSRS